MLIIKINQANALVVTVTQNSELADPEYLFSFTHIFSKETVTFIPTNISSHRSRYDEFFFVEGNGFGEVKFPYEGQYLYTVSEQPRGSGNLNPALAYNVVENGDAQVYCPSAMTMDSQYDIYISNNEDNANIIFAPDTCIAPDPTPSSTPLTPTPTPTIPVTPTPTVTIGLTPTPTPTINLDCPVFLCQASPQWIWNYNPTTNQSYFLFQYSGCATLDMTMTDTKLFYYDGCQDLYEYNYSLINGVFTQSFVKFYDPLSPYAWGAGLTAKDNNTLISSSGYTLSNTVNDYTTIFEYNLTTSGYTGLFQLPYHTIVSGDLLYSPLSGQLVITTHDPFNASSSSIVCYDLSGNTINQVNTPNVIWYSLYYDNTTGDIVALTELGVRAAVNWTAGRVDYLPFIENRAPIWGAGQKPSCQQFIVPSL